MSYIYLIIGLALLVKGADFLIDGSTSLAKRFKVPSLLIGLTVVAVGTSLPEFMINIFSAVQGQTEIAFGNVVGSNIANTFLILGLVAVIWPPKIAHATVWREIPFSLLAAAVLAILVNIPLVTINGVNHLGRVDGFILYAFLFFFLFYLYRSARSSKTDLIDEEMEIEVLTNTKTAAFIAIGIFSLYLGGTWTVDGAVAIARGFGASEFLISATIVAFGTSLPELITSVRAALRNDCDLAVGNVVGSNILNIFWVLGTAALIAPVMLIYRS
ncbi:MAG: Na+/Ca+ antiporter, CaCA family [candidate division CPR2 bacterium GW2011_GWC1_39_9]|uniref:Na+/Ca+ antiporter, CaCA family n=1 Tax=candidate division CPR2 bacterium GW2011_GWC2_39_10 TaxID=1618345 RepID=A0A0G0LPP0_UNCC2|nr:MAG: Na+/Ca+ antiporter, CaCA family [candidate division CPR2 bacterium GW2011_GWC2_39_10]KKR32991.1 MAG: Na+/Ca+ antiporter, CaCA family [candidate division CPR2 bacterium GW2011_GWC1_39_9]